MFWRLKIPARQYSLLFSPQISARQVCQGPLCLSCPAGATRGLFNVFFAPQWISSCLKENTYTLLKVVSLLWVVETVNMIIINHRTIENVTLGPSAWNWTGLSPHKVLFSLPHPGKSTCFHQWKSGPFLTSSSTPHMLSATISWLSYSHLEGISSAPHPCHPDPSITLHTGPTSAAASLTAQPPPVASMIWVPSWSGRPYFMLVHMCPCPLIDDISPLRFLSSPPDAKISSPHDFVHLSLSPPRPGPTHLPSVSSDVTSSKYSPLIPPPGQSFVLLSWSSTVSIISSIEDTIIIWISVFTGWTFVYWGPAALDWNKARPRAHSLFLFQGAACVHVCACVSVCVHVSLCEKTGIQRQSVVREVAWQRISLTDCLGDLCGHHRG